MNVRRPALIKGGIKLRSKGDDITRMIKLGFDFMTVNF
jgi:hypothetical protein